MCSGIDVKCLVLWVLVSVGVDLLVWVLCIMVVGIWLFLFVVACYFVY